MVAGPDAGLGDTGARNEIPSGLASTAVVAMHVVCVESEVVPSPHGTHTSVPLAGAMYPSGQVVHAADPLPEAKVPGAHGAHDALPKVGVA